MFPFICAIVGGFNARLSTIPKRDIPAKMKMGIGCSSSANCGERMFEMRAKRLQIPLVEEAKITGKSIAFEFQSTLRDQELPKFEISKNRGIK